MEHLSALSGVLPVACSNTAAVDVLRKLPGITPLNLAKVLQTINCLADLIIMDEEKLIQLLGIASGRSLYAFINSTPIDETLLE